MRWQPPPRPRWVADAIAIGAALDPLVLHPLDAEGLIAAACRITGLHDFGGDSWREGFDRLCTALIDEARLHAVGAALTRAEITRTLVNRLRIVAAEADTAGTSSASGPVRAPWFVCGTARSGTSILHELLALDPTTRAPRAWEILHSVPAPEPGPPDPVRLAHADHEVRYWDEVTPEYLTMHENGGALPQECIFLTAHEFMSDHWSGVHDVASYNRWLVRADHRSAYAWHRRHLDHLGRRRPTDQWVLKAPSHLATLPALFAEYPDAWVVQTHRDPLRTVPSTISLMATLRWMRSDHVDVERLATTMAKGVAAQLDWVRGMRGDGTLPADRFVDVRFADLMRDPVGAVRSIYDRVGHPFTDEYGEAIRDYLAAKPRAKHGAHRYSATDFGLDPDDLRARYAPYCNAYTIEPED